MTYVIDSKGRRWFLWPIRLAWGSRMALWLASYGWQVGWERVPSGLTSEECVPGWRSVFGWTLHLGRLKVKFGPPPGDRDRFNHWDEPCSFDIHTRRRRFLRSIAVLRGERTLNTDEYQ